MKRLNLLSFKTFLRFYHLAPYGQHVRTHDEIVRDFIINRLQPTAPEEPEIASAVFPSVESLERHWASPSHSSFVQRVLPLLTALEGVLQCWPRQKWAFRLTSNCSATGEASKAVQRELDLIRETLTRHLNERERVQREWKRMTSLTGEQVEEMPRASWIREHQHKLRWTGRVAEANALGDAWRRLQRHAEDGLLLHTHLLERLCCFYGLARLGTFDDAFSNLIVTKEQWAKHQQLLSQQLVNHTDTSPILDSTPIFASLLQLMLVQIPTFPILYDFQGFATQSGATGASYRESLAQYLKDSLVYQCRSLEQQGDGVFWQLQSITDSSPLLVQYRLMQRSNGVESIKLINRSEKRVILFDYCPSQSSSDAGIPPLSDCFLILMGSDVTIIQCASPNRFLRERQVPCLPQLKGLLRRFSLILGIPMDEMRVRTLMLPPTCVDQPSLERLHSVLRVSQVFNNETEQQKLTSENVEQKDTGQTDSNRTDNLSAFSLLVKEVVPPSYRGWVVHYRKKTEDFVVQQETQWDEEWIKL